jgi:UDP-N-acetylglucosamine acyltransferase
MAAIHPTAIVDPKAELASGVTVGPYAVIGPGVRIGAGTRVAAHAVIDGLTTIGERCEVFPMASVGQKTQDLKYKGGKCYLRIGNDNTIREFVTINTATNDGDATVIGNHNLIMAYCHIAHKCVIGNHVIMSNLATLAGDVTVEDYAVLGGMAGIHQFCRIGIMAMVGACTKITQDVVPYTMADGNPAATAGLNKVRMERLGVDDEQMQAIKTAYKFIYRDQLKAKEAVERIRAELSHCSAALHMASFIEASERGIVR